MKIKHVVISGIVALTVLFGLPILWGSWYTISSGEVGIVKTWGAVSSVVGDGLHFKMPIMQSVDKLDIRTRKAHSPSEAGTKDMQRITTEVSVNYHFDQNKIKEIYSSVGIENVEDKIVDPRIQEIVKAVVARFSADALLAQRETVKGEIETSLKKSLAEYHIVLEAVQITNFKFSEQYNQAIEQKQVSEQNAQKAQNDLARIKIEAEQKIVQANAEANAIKIQTDAIKSNGGEAYVQKLAVERWNGELPTYMGGNAPMPFLNIK